MISQMQCNEHLYLISELMERSEYQANNFIISGSFERKLSEMLIFEKLNEL